MENKQIKNQSNLNNSHELDELLELESMPKQSNIFSAQKLMAEIGDEDALADLESILTESEKYYLHNFLLNNYENEAGNTYYTPEQIKECEDVYKTIQDIIGRRESCKNFILSYGGTGFLLDEFGITLSGDQYFVLKNILMDYHYHSITDVANGNINTNKSLSVLVDEVLVNLKSYKERRSQIESYLARVGGEEVVLEKVVQALDDIDKTIFFDMIMTYNPLQLSDVSRNVCMSMSKVSIRRSAIIDKLKKLEASLASCSATASA